MVCHAHSVRNASLRTFCRFVVERIAVGASAREWSSGCAASWCTRAHEDLQRAARTRRSSLAAAQREALRDRARQPGPRAAAVFASASSANARTSASPSSSSQTRRAVRRSSSGHVAIGEDEVRSRTAAWSPDAGLARQLQHGADRARIAEREQTSGTANRCIRRATRERSEQRFELGIGQRLGPDRWAEIQLRLELLRDLIERLLDARHRRVDPGREPRPLHHRREERRGPDAGVFIVERARYECASRGVGRANHEPEHEQCIGADIGRASRQRRAHRIERRRDLAQRRERATPHVRRIIAQCIRDHAGGDHRGGRERDQRVDGAQPHLFGRGHARSDRGERLIALEREHRLERADLDRRLGARCDHRSANRGNAALTARLHDRGDRGRPHFGRRDGRREIEQHARFIFGDLGERRDRRELHLDCGFAIANRCLESIELGADRDRLEHRFHLGTEHDRLELARRARDPQPADRGLAIDRRRRPRLKRDRRQRADLRLDRPRPRAAVDEPRLDDRVLANGENPAWLVSACIVDDDRPEHEPAHCTLMTVIARSILRLDVADDEAQPQRAVAAADGDATITDARDRANPAVTARRHRARGFRIRHRCDPQLTIRRTGEQQRRRIECDRVDRAASQCVARHRPELRGSVLDREPDHVQRAVDGADREHSDIAARRAGIQGDRAHARAELHLREDLAAGDIPRDQPAIVAAA